MSNVSSVDDEQWLTILRCAGPDRTSFLQGQLTQDVGLLDSGRPALPAGCCDAKGRVIATMTLVWQPDELVIAVNSQVAELLRDHLLKYRLRAKVDITADPTLGIASDLAQSTGHQVALWRKDGNGWRVGVLREELIASADFANYNEIPSSRWRQLRMAAGVLDLPAASSGQFTPHMLNLDRINAISFSKGCYTGQEIVARTEHRGSVKRRARLMRLCNGKDQPVRPGQSVFCGQEKIGLVACVAAHVLACVCAQQDETATFSLDDGRSVAFLE